MALRCRICHSLTTTLFSMPGRALSDKAKRQKQRKLINNKYSNTIHEYRRQKHEQDGKPSYRRIAAEYGVEYSTLRRLEQGGNSISAFNLTKQRLTTAEESILVNLILLAALQGFPKTHRTVAREANAILANRLGVFRPVGKNWVDNFLCRHNNALHTFWSRPLSTIRAKAVNPDNLKDFFDMIYKQIVAANVPPELFFAMDETGCPPERNLTQRVIGPKGSHRQHKQGTANKETITVLATICADGSALEPTIIFKGKNLMAKWRENNVSNAS